ncbi:hypothetical protein ACGFJ5_18705 [Micromonospora echinaurantiaca]|uniref:hypothetical protein n=1 Tax=Micromonospora echinaurantiaca TaxID=47857 RepID=UPI003422E7DE
MAVIHQPRVAWDAARVLVWAVTDDAVLDRLGAGLGDLLGPGYEQSLRDTRDRLRWNTDGDRLLVEAGLWRVRLEDALRTRPEAAEPIRQLTESCARLLRDRRVTG